MALNTTENDHGFAEFGLCRSHMTFVKQALLVIGHTKLPLKSFRSKPKIRLGIRL